MRARFSASVAVAIALAVAMAARPGQASADDPPHRDVPDYDSRPEANDDGVEVLLWIPRIVTGPLYLVSEYLIRLPLGAFITWVEQNDVVDALFSVFTFGRPERDVAVLVTAFYDFGFLPSVGLYAFWNNFGATGNRLSMHGATWGEEWLSFTATDRATLSDGTIFFGRGGYVRRPDYVIGSGAVLDDDPGVRTRYASESVDGEVGYELHPTARSLVAGSVFGRWARFEDSTFNGDSSLSERADLLSYQRGVRQALPQSYTDGYAYLSLRARAVLDTRDPTGVPSAGFRISGHGEVAAAFHGIPGSRWFLVGGQVLGATDFLGGRRTLSLALEASTLLPVSGSEVPFDRQIDAGGQGPLQGFLPGDIVGGSAIAATLAYEWPVWLFLNARIYVAAGNAFDYRFEDFAMERLRLSFGFALRPPTPGEHPFEIGISAGTDPFEQGASVSAFRFFVGARNDL